MVVSGAAWRPSPPVPPPPPPPDVWIPPPRLGPRCPTSRWVVPPLLPAPHALLPPPFPYHSPFFLPVWSLPTLASPLPTVSRPFLAELSFTRTLSPLLFFLPNSTLVLSFLIHPESPFPSSLHLTLLRVLCLPPSQAVSFALHSSPSSIRCPDLNSSLCHTPSPLSLWAYPLSLSSPRIEWVGPGVSCLHLWE